MSTTVSSFTVFFEAPFWVGVCQRESGGTFEAARVVFGAEPKEPELLVFALTRFSHLCFSPALSSDHAANSKGNPKRMQRDIRRQLQSSGVGTKAQEALKLLQQQGKLQRKTHRSHQAQERKEEQFLLRQQKRREKHRGH